jgi:hypothetical protein
LRPYMEDIYCIRTKTPFWKWRNGDLAIRLWYRDVGSSISFDMLHLIEWDLLLFDSLDNIYRGIPENSIGVASLLSVDEVGKDWVWTNKEPYKKEFTDLVSFVSSVYGVEMIPYAIQGPGLCMPRKFIEMYCTADIPEWCNDEIRIPVFSLVFGFKMYNVRFCEKWPDLDNQKTFHCQLFPEISEETIIQELDDPTGKRVFHPHRRTLGAGVGMNKTGMMTGMRESLADLWKRFFHCAGKMLRLHRL